MEYFLEITISAKILKRSAIKEVNDWALNLKSITAMLDSMEYKMRLEDMLKEIPVI